MATVVLAAIAEGVFEFTLAGVVVTRTALQDIAARTVCAINQIEVAVASDEGVVTAAPVDEVIVVTASNGVSAIVPIQRVIDPIVTLDQVEAFAATDGIAAVLA